MNHVPLLAKSMICQQFCVGDMYFHDEIPSVHPAINQLTVSEPLWAQDSEWATVNKLRKNLHFRCHPAVQIIEFTS